MPPSFKQMLVILYRDSFSGKPYLGLFALINNKFKNGYNYLFKKIYSIISIEDSKKLNLITYSCDFEPALIDSLEKNFSNKRVLGCFFHYTKNLLKHAKQISLFNNELKKYTKDLLTE